MSAITHLLQRLRRRIDLAWLETREQQLALWAADLRQRVADDGLQLLAVEEQLEQAQAELKAARSAALQPHRPHHTTRSTP